MLVEAAEVGNQKRRMREDRERGKEGGAEVGGWEGREVAVWCVGCCVLLHMYSKHEALK